MLVDLIIFIIFKIDLCKFDCKSGDLYIKL